MADLTLGITITVTEQGQDVVADLIKRLTNLEGPLKVAGKILEDAIPKAFEQGDKQWVALAPWTQFEREEQGYGAAGPKLVRTGTYRDSFGYVVDENGVYLTSIDDRLETLNYGGVTDTGHAVPARPIEDVFPEDAVEEAANAFWQEIIKD